MLTNPIITIHVKDFGEIKIELLPEHAKNTVNNFLYHVKNNYYNNLIFHRIIKGFMIQGGAGNRMNPIKGEFNENGFNNPLKHTSGVISMARTNDKNSQSTQFFIMHKDAPHLDGLYAAFGHTISGLDVVDKIASVKTDDIDKPLNDVIIEKIVLELNDYNYEPPIF